MRRSLAELLWLAVVFAAIAVSVPIGSALGTHDLRSHTAVHIGAAPFKGEHFGKCWTLATATGLVQACAVEER